MKTLLLLRHAKAVEPDDFVAEHDRTLTPRGEEDAVLVGEHLREQGPLPDRVISSTAARASRTAQLAVARLGRAVPTDLMREIYNASSGGLFDTIRRSAGESQVLLLVGHNPGIQALAVALAGAGDPDELARMHEKFSPGALAVVRTDAKDWSELAPSRGTLERFVRPKELRD